MIVGEIVKTIEAFAPLEIQEKWDNSGLCIGSYDSEVKGVLLGFDCTPDLVDEAIECGANLIITHHPLIFGGIKKISSEDIVGRSIIKAISNGISIYSAHTNADKVIGGVSGSMASKLGLSSVTPLECDKDGIGLGALGIFLAPKSAEEIFQIIKEKFKVKVIKSSKPLSGLISKVAVCGGSGASLIEVAMTAGAQLYISADISYHHFFTNENFMIMDIGHFESEVDIVDILFSILKKNFSNFAIHISKNLLDSNPIYYIK